MINNKQYRSKSFIILGENNLSIFKGSLLPVDKISPEAIKQLLEKDQIEEVILKEEEEKDISIEVSFTVVNENELSIIEDKNNNNNGKRGKRKLNVNE